MRNILYDTGEFAPGQCFGITDDDGTSDVYPQYPEDSDIKFCDASVSIL